MTRQAGPVVLAVTEIDDPTTDSVIDELNRRGRVTVCRLDLGDFPREATLAASLDPGSGRWAGRLATPSRDVDLADVAAVYWRRPTPYRFTKLDPQAREFAIGQAKIGFSGILTSLHGASYINHPHRNCDAEYKPAQLAVAAQVGFDVPATLVTSDPVAARAFATTYAPVVFKALRLTDLHRDGQPVMPWTQRISVADLDDSVAGTAHLFQAEIVDKVADLRITVVGERVFCVRIESTTGALDWRSDYESLLYCAVDPPASLVPMLKRYLARFGLVFGCFDFSLAFDGTPWFLECNPNGQWGWLEDATGLPITAAFTDTLEGAL